MPSQSRIYLANVGVNAGHTLRSPLFDDGRFEFLPIPDEPTLEGQDILRYRDLRSYYEPDESLERFIPRRYLACPVHSDPEFETFTYGDNCADSPRAAALRRLRPGDVLLFLARLSGWSNGRFTGRYGFYFIGYLEIEEVYPVRLPLTEEQLARCGRNAHVRRALAEASGCGRGKGSEDFWVFRGGARSRRLCRARALEPELASRLFRDRDGNPWVWTANRSDLQVIGSYTRTCRCFVDPDEKDGAERAALLWSVLQGQEGHTPYHRLRTAPLRGHDGKMA